MRGVAGLLAVVLGAAVAAAALGGVPGAQGQSVYFRQTTRAIRVALFRPLCEFGQEIDDLLAQLQADEYYDLDVEWVDDSNMTTLAAVQAYDVVCLFSSGNFPGDSNKIADLTLNNVRDFVAGGGGLVTSWDFAAALTQVSKIDAIKDAVPVEVGASSGYVDHDPLPSFTNAAPSHPVMRFVPPTWSTVVRCGYMPTFNASATLLLSVSGTPQPPIPGADDKAAFAMDYGAGRVVWLCLPYCGFFLNQVQNTRFGEPNKMLYNSLFWTSRVPLLCPNVQCSYGTCTGPDNCTCDSGYTGVNCTEPDCSGIGGCKNNGTCVPGGICSCPNGTGFGGVDCSIADCNDCVHGSCATPNNCTCDPGYNGTSCNLPVCDFGGAGGCLNSGFCVDPDTCQCQGAYEGNRCQTFVPSRGCQGAFACRHGGSCVESTANPFGECNCTGTSHSGAICNNPDYSCTPPCEHGVCRLVGSGPATECDCDFTGYNGTECEIPICTELCVPGQGTCISPNYCDCNTTFAGNTCERLANPPNCANGGFLDGVSCNCTGTGWGGPVCNTPICNVSCGQNGTCVGPDTCLCEQGWDGPDCTVPVCLPACRQNGTCVSPPTNCDCSTANPCFEGFLCAIRNLSLPGCVVPTTGTPPPPPPGPTTGTSILTGPITIGESSGNTFTTEQLTWGIIGLVACFCLCLCLGICGSAVCDKKKKKQRQEDWFDDRY